MHKKQTTANLQAIFNASDQRKAKARFAYYFFPLLLITTTIYLALCHHNFHQVVIQAQQQETGRLDTLSQLWQSDFDAIGSDIRTIANSELFLDYWQSPTEVRFKRLENLLLQFSSYRKLYAQIRLLDKAGNEFLRIDYKDGQSGLIPKEQLQDKSDRYYFQESVGLSKGELYLSPLDLNVENGSIETPIKPVMRIVTPLFDLEGAKRGILVFNYLAERMLSRLERLDQQTTASMQLLNHQGDWLYHSDKNLSWGFMRGEPHRYSEQYPARWSKMSAETTSGTLSNGNQIQTFLWISPQHWLNSNLSETYDFSGWLLLSEYPLDNSFLNIYVQSDQTGFIIFCLSLILIGYAAWLYAQHRFEQDNRINMRNLAFTSLEQNPSAIIITNTDAIITYSNQRLTELTGYSQEYFLGKSPSVLQSGLTSKQTYQSLWKALHKGESWSGDMINNKADGSQYWAHCLISPITNSAGVVTHYMSIQEDVTQQKKQQEKLTFLANHDSLTGLLNRRKVLSSLNDELERASRYQHPISLMILDIDHFKRINDNFGHQAGDAVLKEVALRLQSTARQTDFVGRYGGEEFLIVLPETDQNSAKKLAERILKIISAQPFIYQEDRFDITISIGYLTHHASLLKRSEILIQAVDNALYQAKNDGRNRAYCAQVEEQLSAT